jgi:hypothetical protein
MEETHIKLDNKHFRDIKDNIPLEAIKTLADKSISSGDKDKIVEAMQDIYVYTNEFGYGNIYMPIIKADIATLSCIKHINEHSMSEYLGKLTSYACFSLSNQDRDSIHVLESHFKHIHGFWMVKAFDHREDLVVAEISMTILVNAIGMLRGFHGMEKSPTVLECRKQKEEKCHVWNCPNKSELSFIMPFGIMQLCAKCNDKIKQSDANAKMCAELLKQSDGKMITIKTWKEYDDRLMPEFLQLLKDGLKISGDKCCVCGDKAVGTGLGFKPYCRDCMGFPLRVLKVALRN